MEDTTCVEWPLQNVVDFKRVQRTMVKIPVKPTIGPWQPPQNGLVKVNVDASWCACQRKVGLGVIVCDFSDMVLGVMTSPIDSSISVQVAEA